MPKPSARPVATFNISLFSFVVHIHLLSYLVSYHTHLLFLIPTPPASAQAFNIISFVWHISQMEEVQFRGIFLLQGYLDSDAFYTCNNKKTTQMQRQQIILNATNNVRCYDSLVTKSKHMGFNACSRSRPKPPKCRRCASSRSHALQA